MVLCFGTFASILKVHKNNIREDMLIARLIKCIAPENPYIRYNSLKDKEKLVSEKSWEEFEVIPSAINKIIRCKRNYVSYTDPLPFKEVVDNIIKHFIPHIISCEIPEIILSLMDIIHQDESLSSKHKELFKECFGVYKHDFLQSGVFFFPDFVAKCLKYTTSLSCINKDGESHVTRIDEKYCKQIWKIYGNKYIWNPQTYIFEFTFREVNNIVLPLAEISDENLEAIFK